MSTEELLNTLSRYVSKPKVYSIRRKIQKLGLEKIAKIQNISKNDFNKVTKLQEKSIDKLKAIARLRRINNFKKLTKEDLILTLLKSESNDLENNNNNNNDDDDNNNNDKNNDKTRYIRLVFGRLVNTITNQDRKKIKKELYEIEKNQNLSDSEKEKTYDNLFKLVRTLDKKVKYQYQDRDDLDYYGIKGIENLFNDDTDDTIYYKPILIDTSF